MKTLKPILMGALLMGSAALVRADSYTVTFNLSSLNAGSMLTGVLDTTGAFLPGDSAGLTLSFSDPSDYSTPTVSTTLSAGTGIFTETFSFTTMTFKDLTNGQTVNLEVDVSARCAATPSGLPCDAVGIWEDDNPARYTGLYSVVGAAGSTVPEPAYGMVLLGAGALLGAYKKLRG